MILEEILEEILPTQQYNTAARLAGVVRENTLRRPGGLLSRPLQLLQLRLLPLMNEYFILEVLRSSPPQLL